MEKKYHIVRTVPKSYWKIVGTEEKSILLTHIYMTAHSPGLIQALVLFYGCAPLRFGTNMMLTGDWR